MSGFRFGPINMAAFKVQDSKLGQLQYYPKNYGSNIEVVHKYSLKKLTTEDLTIRNAPVGGHTCITAGEQGEPAVVLYERINLSVPVGGPTAPGYATNCFKLSGCCGSSYGDR